jgi:hypothetical protein
MASHQIWPLDYAIPCVHTSLLLPQWCNNQTAPNHEGVDYCAPAQLYKNVPLTFSNLVLTNQNA